MNIRSKEAITKTQLLKNKIRLLLIPILMGMVLGCSIVPNSNEQAKPLVGDLHQEPLDSLGCDESCESMFAKLKKYARFGSPDAQTFLAVSYRGGESTIPRDSFKAWKWIKRAAKQRHPPALHIKSMWHREGYARAVNVELADQYLVKSAERGYAPAILDLAILNFKRHQDKEGFRLLSKVTKMGYPKAKQVMALLKAEPPEINAHSMKEKDNSQSEVELSDMNSEGEVMTIIADRQDPITQVADLITMIRTMTLYNERGRSGTRVGDMKCGQVGSFCRIDDTMKIQ